MPDGETNVAYSQTLSATGGNGALVWSLASGTLPSGLSLSSTDVLSGTPSAPGTATFTVKVADSDLITGASDEATRAFSLTIAAPALPAAYTAWANSYALANDERDPLVDPDSDGIANLAEFAFASDPTTSNPQGHTVSILAIGEHNYPVVTFVRRQNLAPVVITVAVSADLNPAADLGSVAVSTTPRGDGTETAIIRSAVPLSTHPRQFFHLKALLP